MDRARLQHPIFIEQSDNDIQESAQRTVTIYEADGTTLLAQSLYDVATGGSPVANPTTTNSSGFLKKYVDRPQPVKLSVTGITDQIDSEFVARADRPAYQRGPIIFDVEAYANNSDLNDDGTFKITVDASVAWNLALDAIRAATISPGALGWAPGRVLRYNSAVYLIEHTLKFIGLSSCTVTPAIPGATTNLYSGDGWAGPPSGSPGALAGMTAAQAPMVDACAMAGCNIWGMVLCAQTILDGDPAPAVRPAVGWLIGATQTYSGSAWGATNGDSGNNTYRNCGAVGWTKYADLAVIGSVLSTWYDFGSQSYSNESNSMSWYLGCTTLDTSGNPSITGTAFDSVWYPTSGSPTATQKRLLRSAAGGSTVAGSETGGTSTELVFFRSECHDMYPTVAVAHGGSADAQTNKQRTVLIHRVNGLKLFDVPISSSGVAQIDLWGQSQNVDLDMCQNYNKGGTNARSNYFIRMMGCNITNPIKGLRIHNLMGTTAPQVGWIGCDTASANDSPAFVDLNIHDNNISSAVPMFKTLASYSGAATEVNLAYSDIDLHGCQYEFGGSIGETVILRNIPPGGEQWSSSGGGTNKADRHFTNGTRSLYGPLTVASGAITATAGDLVGRHLLGNGTAIATGDIALTGDWGTGPAKSAISGTDTAFKFRVTSGTGAVSANPVVTLTYKSAFTNIPIADVSLFIAGVKSNNVFWTEGTTTLQITVIASPNVPDTTTYDFRVHVIGF